MPEGRCALERNGDALAAFQTLEVHPGPVVPDLGGVGARVGHDLVGHMGPAAAPLFPHLPVQERVLGPAVLLEQAVQTLAFGTVSARAVPDGLLDRHLGRLPRRRDVPQGIRQRGLAQPRRQPVPVIPLRHPGIADLVGGLQDRGHPAAPLPRIRAHLSAQDGDPGQTVVLGPVQALAAQAACDFLNHQWRLCGLAFGTDATHTIDQAACHSEPWSLPCACGCRSWL